MTQPDWPGSTSRRIASEIKRLRAGNSVQWLSDRTAELGHRVSRSTIADMEVGRRSRIEVVELIILARALGVPPLLLLYPGVPGEAVEAVPGVEGSSWEAAQWFSGERALEVVPERRLGQPLVRGFTGGGSTGEWAQWTKGAERLWRLREEAGLWDALAERERAVGDARAQNAEHPNDAGAAQFLEYAQDQVKAAEDRIRRNRDVQRNLGMTPAPMADRYAHIDQGSDDD